MSPSTPLPPGVPDNKCVTFSLTIESRGKDCPKSTDYFYDREILQDV